MKSKQLPNRGLTREAAMNAYPHPMSGIRIDEEADGSVKVFVCMKRSPWQKWFGAPPEYEKQYLIEGLGREVFKYCDGNVTVKEIVGRLSEKYKLNIAEAEMAVTTYLRTLMTKGVIGMAIGMERAE